MTYRFFVAPAAAGYGARIYLEGGSLHHKPLKEASIWKGADKRVEADGMLFLGYEMLPIVADNLAAWLVEQGTRQLSLEEWIALER